MSKNDEQSGLKRTKEAGGVDAVDRALSILLAFHDHGGQMSLTQISERTGLYKSTILRITASLEQAGFLRRQENKIFTLGSELFRLGLLYQRALKIEDIVRPALKQLVASTGESASFFVRQADMRLCLFREESQHAIRDHVVEGEVLTLDRGAAGHILKDYDPNILAPAMLAERLQRLPIVTIGERAREVAAAAVPVFRHAAAGPELAGALTVSGPRTRFTEDAIAQIGAELLDKTRCLSRLLGTEDIWTRDVAESNSSPP